MKFKTFMRLVFVGIILLLGGTCYGCYSLMRNRPATGHEPPPQAAPTTETYVSEGVVQATPTTPLEKKILGKIGTEVAPEKRQDAFPGGPRVDLFQDGDRGIDRVEIDLDRDGQWDERWVASAPNGVEQIKRQVSTADDGRYDRSYLYSAGGWADLAELGRESEPGALRSFDQAILDKARQPISGDKVKDALPGAVKVNLYQDRPGQGVNRAKLDLDRDDRFDEKWTFEADGRVKRQVAPNDDEKYTVEYRLQNGRWAKK